MFLFKVSFSLTKIYNLCMDYKHKKMFFSKTQLNEKTLYQQLQSQVKRVGIRIFLAWRSALNR